MGIPYLKSGESIILTADRINADAVAYDAMMTSRSLILIDSRTARSEPRIIDLAGIRSVRSGRAATGEPVIILTLAGGEDDEIRRDLLFTQAPGENRVHERDIWLRKLIELSVSGKGPAPAPKEEGGGQHLPAGGGMQPSVRRWLAPDIIRPRTGSQPRDEPAPPVVISIDDPEPERGSQEDPGADPEPVVEPPADETPGPAAEEPAHDAGGAGNVPAPGLQIDPSTILVAVRSLTEKAVQQEAKAATIRLTSPLPELPQPGPAAPAGDEKSSQPVVVEEEEPEPAFGDEIPAPDIRTRSLLPEIPLQQPEKNQDPPHPLPVPAPEAQVPAVYEAAPGPEPVHTPVPDSREPVAPPEPAATPKPAAATRGRRGKNPAVKTPEKTGAGPAGRPAVVPPALPAAGLPKEKAARSPAPSKDRSIIITVAAIILLLLAVFAIPIISGGKNVPPYAPEDIPATIAVTATTTTPAPAPAEITREGVWVRIICPGHFTGKAGSVDHLQQVSGTGEKYVKALSSESVVSAIIEKTEDSGDELRVEMYRDGRLIASRSTSTPRGSVNLLIDPATGQAPGLTTVTTAKATPASGKIEYL
ncbi:MAG: hypothetical protein GYA23_01990 [Methanomicrobiales archaeon]|nr:hypothetical protein [Methanomicrobiales archaeon]